MLNTKLTLSLAAATVAGGLAAYKFLKPKFTPQPVAIAPDLPAELIQAAPETIYQRVKPTPAKQKTLAELTANLKSATQTVKSALKLTVVMGQGLLISGTAAVILATKALSTATGNAIKTTPESGSPFTPRWIISRNDDLIYLIGSVGVSAAFIFATFVLKIDPMLLWWLWALVLDGPHVWGTATRTYFDKVEIKNRSRLLLGSLSWFGIGAGLAALNIDLFRAFAYSWAYYHLVKQHYGFMILYKKKNNDLAKFDNFIDKALVWVGFGFPFINSLFKKDAPSVFKMAQQLVPVQFHGYVYPVTLAVFLGTLGVYVARQFFKLTASMPLDVPKHLLLASSIGLHIAVGALPYGQFAAGLLLIVATLTAYHNVQYQRLMWFHNRNKYGKGEIKETLETFGLAAYFGRNFWVYLGSGIVFTLFYRPVLLRKMRGGRYANMVEGFFWGFAFLHYYLDSKIWRVRSDKRLNQALKMDSKAA